MPQNEILTIQEVAALLKMSVRQIYSMTCHRGQVRMEHPIPMIKINGNIRFLRSDIDAWVNQLAESGRAA